jgi:hypothetical protein
MNNRSLFLSAAGSALAITLLAHAGDKVKLDVKLGLWEVTTSGKPMSQIPEEMLQSIPPERRQQVIASMQAAMTKPETHQQCLTAAKLAQGFDFGERHASCQKTVETNTSSSMSVTANCTSPQGKEVVKASFQASSRENVTGNINVAMSRGTQTMTMDRDFHAKWLGADCGNVKD